MKGWEEKNRHWHFSEIWEVGRKWEDNRGDPFILLSLGIGEGNHDIQGKSLKEGRK